MSYILDALKKSENERRQQQEYNSSGDFSAPEVQSQPESKRGLLLVVVILLVVTNFAVLAYLWFSNSDQEAIKSVSPQALNVKVDQTPVNNSVVNNSATMIDSSVRSITPSAELEKPSQANLAAQQNPSTAESVEKKQPQNTLNIYQTPSRFQTQPASDTQSQTVAESQISNYPEQQVIGPGSKYVDRQIKPESNEEDPMVIKPGNGLVDRYQQALEDAKLPQHNFVNLSSGQADFHKTAETANASKTTESNVIKPQALTVSNNQNTSDLSELDVTRLPTIKDLNANDRALLPELKFTSHLFSSNPASRSVRFSGQKFREGDAISSDLTLYQITEDGVVLDLSGLQFYMSSYQDWVPR